MAAVGQKLTYAYDFGDNWQHRIDVEKRSPAVEGRTYLPAVHRRPPSRAAGGLRGLGI